MRRGSVLLDEGPHPTVIGERCLRPLSIRPIRMHADRVELGQSAGGEKRLQELNRHLAGGGPDDRQANAVLPRESQEAVHVIGSNGDVLRTLASPAIARRAPDAARARRLPESPGESMLAAAAPYDQHPHVPQPLEINGRISDMTKCVRQRQKS